MENLKKNFEEPVVQIINMCFCENIATSGAIASCPAGKEAVGDSKNQICQNCKVVYAASLVYPQNVTLGLENITGFNYIKGNESVKTYLKTYSSKNDINKQIPDVIDKLGLKCPKYEL